MVDLAEIQTAYYMVAATGVLVAAYYYVQNIKESARNRKSTFTTNLMSIIYSKDGVRDWYEIMSMQWIDFDDFSRKYDSRVNPENYIKREHYWSYLDAVGWQLRSGFLDWDTVYKTAKGARTMWLKFKPIMDEYRRREYGLDAYVDWEYLANRMEANTSLEDKRIRQFMVDDAFRHENVKAF
jgi:hypothetical protein